MPQSTPVSCLIDEAAELRVVGRGVEAEGAGGLLQAELDGRGLLLVEERIADLERAGRLVHALGEQLGGIRRPLDVLPVEARHDAERQLIEQAEAAADGHERPLAGKDDGRCRSR